MKLTVEGMTGSDCVRSVTNAILSLDLGARVNVDLAAKLVRTQGRFDSADVIKAIEGAGYEATLAEVESPSAGHDPVDPVDAGGCCGGCHAGGR